MEEVKPQSKPAAIEENNFIDIIKGLNGKAVTIVNPESYEDAPVGHQIKAGFYRAKVVAVGNDYIVLVTEFKKAGREAAKEPVKQYVPINQIKRISLMKAERILHI